MPPPIIPIIFDLWENTKTNNSYNCYNKHNPPIIPIFFDLWDNTTTKNSYNCYNKHNRDIIVNNRTLHSIMIHPFVGWNTFFLSLHYWRYSTKTKLAINAYKYTIMATEWHKRIKPIIHVILIMTLIYIYLFKIRNIDCVRSISLVSRSCYHGFL